jgi:sugar lactone lactonase YvrE
MIQSNQHDISTLHKAGCYLGESPFWHTIRKSCLWVDIEKGRLYELRCNTGQIQIWELNIRVSFIIEHKNGQILLGVQGGVMIFNLDNGCIKWLKRIETHNGEYRCNDGYCDPSGRIWLGIMHMEAKPLAGSLYCLHPNLDLKKMIGNLTIPNGIAWATDQHRLYFVDSVNHDVNSYVFNEASNKLVLEKVIIHIPKEKGTPDGITLDNEGMLWIALYGGFNIIRCNPIDGTVLDIVQLPVPNVTNCCFAGPELGDLVITTAREHMNEKELLKYPESGNIFVVKRIGATGISNFKSDLEISS